MVLWLIALAADSACAAVVSGVVYVDRNGDRVRQASEPGVAGAVVAYERGRFTTTDVDGAYHLDVPSVTGFLWVRVPDGFRPGPIWRPANGPDLDLPLVPLTADEVAAPLTFVVAADSHTDRLDPADPWDGGDLADAIDQALALGTPPRFFTIVGDITQANRAEEFDRVDAALAGVTVPWVPVPGNHDWYDGGVAYRGRWGPDNYSFDIGDLHVVVWDTNLSEADQVAFFTAELALVDPGMTVVALGHGSPRDEVAGPLEALGVDYLFTGHWHANRRVERTGMVEWGTQTFVMGGIDQSPSGYRVVTFDPADVAAEPTIIHRERLVEPHLGLVSPHAGSCASPAGFELLVAAALDASPPEVTAILDCGATRIPLASVGGWTHRAMVGPLAPGQHQLTLQASTPSGRAIEQQVAFTVCDPAAPPIAGSWPQIGGGPAHTGRQDAPIAPPLQSLWTRAVGGSIALGSPVVADGVVVVSVADRAGGNRGGLVALELATGVERWRYTTPYPTSNAPAIESGIVVVGLGNGELHAVDLADGAPRWIFDAADGLPMLESSLWAAPTIADGVVYVALQGAFTAIDLATGDEVWRHDRTNNYPWLGSLAAVAIADGTALAAFNRDDGLVGASAATGSQTWANTSGATVAINATPIVDNGVVYLANARGEVSAAELATGRMIWTRATATGGFDWGYTITAAPALAGGRLFVPSQWDDLIALDADTGAELWRYTTTGGPLNFAHYRSTQAGFAASPVVTGDLVWIGRPDGKLVALDVADGAERFSTQLGAPIVSAPAPAGGYLVVATYDGSVHALGAGPVMTVATPTRCDAEPPDPADDGGCCSTGRRDGPASAALAVAVIALLVRRRRGAFTAR